MAYPRVEVRHTVPTAGYAVSVTPAAGAPTTVTIPAGTYYLSTAGSGSRSLLDELAYQLTNTVGAGGTHTVTASLTTDAATGFVTITRAGGNFDLTWTSTALRDALGFAGGLSGAATYTGTRQAQPLWIPQAAYVAVHGTTRGVPTVMRGLSVAPTGKAIAVRYATRYPVELVWHAVKGRWIRTSWESTVNEAWERIFDAYLPDSPVRIYPDRSVASYRTYVLTDDAMAFASSIGGGWEGAASPWNVTMRGEEQP